MSRLADEIERRVDAAAIDVLHDIGLDLQGRAQRDAPVDEATLRGSADYEVDARRRTVTVSFNTPYAAKQEVEDDYTHPRGGKSHYLGDNVKAMAPAYRIALQRAMNKATKGL